MSRRTEYVIKALAAAASLAVLGYLGFAAATDHGDRPTTIVRDQ